MASREEIPRECPECKSDLRGPEIPEEYRALYSAKATHYSRVVSIYDQRLDRGGAWRCPDCGHGWQR